MSQVHPNGGDMRMRGEWMKPIDDPLLEVLRDAGNLTPKAISRDGMVERVDISRKYAGQRLRSLEEHGLVGYVDEGLFRISERGVAYLEEEFDASTLDD